MWEICRKKNNQNERRRFSISKNSCSRIGKWITRRVTKPIAKSASRPNEKSFSVSVCFLWILIEIKWQYTKYSEYDVYPVGWHLSDWYLCVLFVFAFFFYEKMHNQSRALYILKLPCILFFIIDDIKTKKREMIQRDSLFFIFQIIK